MIVYKFIIFMSFDAMFIEKVANYSNVKEVFLFPDLFIKNEIIM